MINIKDKDETGFSSIEIKDEYRFELNSIFYKDACHKIDENREEN